ncbi:CdaR family protein [uncultured Desulfobulbus sp.]|uniref:CdaR family protein n=1 Tax=uncultured Desulfobulbus sp. TaxID=239745 RepID=UPI0029C639BA|nr:CdaR family protein [uncultured Desulfobulbus sp.]
MIRQNLKYKLLALILAIIIWGYADAGQNRNAVKELSDLTIQLKNIDPNFLASCRPNTVNITFKGSRANLNALTDEAEQIKAYIDLQGLKKGQYSLPVHLTMPDGYSSLVNKEILPDKVFVVLEDKIGRSLWIDLRMLSETPKGYQFGAPIISRNKANVSGPSKLVNSISNLVVSIDPKDSASNIEGDFTVEALDKNGKKVQGVDIAPEKVHLVMKMIKSPSSKIAFISPDLVGQLVYPYQVTSIDIEPQTVVISGKPELLAGMNIINTKPINLAGHVKTFTEDAELDVPAGVNIIGSVLIKATVHIESSDNAGQDKNAVQPDSGGR